MVDIAGGKGHIGIVVHRLDLARRGVEAGLGAILRESRLGRFLGPRVTLGRNAGQPFGGDQCRRNERRIVFVVVLRVAFDAGFRYFLGSPGKRKLRSGLPRAVVKSIVASPLLGETFRTDSLLKRRGSRVPYA